MFARLVSAPRPKWLEVAAWVAAAGAFGPGDTESVGALAFDAGPRLRWPSRLHHDAHRLTERERR